MMRTQERCNQVKDCAWKRFFVLSRPMPSTAVQHINLAKIWDNWPQMLPLDPCWWIRVAKHIFEVTKQGSSEAVGAAHAGFITDIISIIIIMSSRRGKHRCEPH